MIVQTRVVDLIKVNFENIVSEDIFFYECGVDPQFQCPVCLKRFADKGRMKRHAVNVHHQISL